MNIEALPEWIDRLLQKVSSRSQSEIRDVLPSDVLILELFFLDALFQQT